VQAEHPFVGPDFQFLRRTAASPEWVERVHNFTFSAFMNHGPITGDVPAISVGAERLATGIAATLFAEDYEHTWQKLLSWDNPELRGDEFTIDDNIAAFAADAATSEV
jgi:hypothetical protein